MKCKIIAAGAAGNKIAVELVERELISDKNILLINSTTKDVPDANKASFIQIGNLKKGGCGKERSLAQEMIYESLENDKLNEFDRLLEPDDDGIIIITSTEGGTGSGSTPTIAKYFRDVIGTHVHIIAMTGFEEDARGMENTINFFNELEEDYTIQIISNKKFLDEARGNKLKAEKLANEEVLDRLLVYFGGIIHNAEQNIDETDLYKIDTTPGYMTIERASLDKIKNVSQFNEVVNNMIDISKSLDVEEPGCKRMGVILTTQDKTKDYIDYSFSVLKERYGIPYELFQHIQDGKEDSIVIIVSGMRMPIDELKETLNKYKEEFEKVNKNKDDFFNSNIGISSSGLFDSARSKKVQDNADDRKKIFLKQKNNKNDGSIEGKY